MSATRAEICVGAMADVFLGDGESFASPMGTIPAIGARLAALTTSPDLVFSDGEALLCGDVSPVGAAPGVVEGWMPFARVFDVLWWGRRHVIMGASQIDQWGNQNISAIGPFAQPKRQLLGMRGAPGNTVSHTTSYWVPKHSTRVFVPEVDIVSGVGTHRAREAGPLASEFHEIRRVVTNLAVLDLLGPDQTMRLVSVHPGVSVDEVVAATSFALDIPADVPETRTPSDEELRLIRDVVDPQGFREREVPNP